MNIFYGTNIPTCILVFKKCREDSENILFMDASRHFQKIKSQNYLRDEDIGRIVSTYVERSGNDRFSFVATRDEVKENEYNLNIPRYVDTFEAEDEINLELVSTELKSLEAGINETDKTIRDFCKQLDIQAPF